MFGNKFAAGMGPNQTSFKKGEHRSLRTEFKMGEMSEKQKGENNSFWKGGISLDKKEYKKFLSLSKKETIAGRKKPSQCEVCGSIGRICFDHDHITGKFRGWLCFRCNIVLGFVKDNTELLDAIKNYLINEK